MRYVLYVFTMALLFVGGMLVGNNFLPTRDTSLASAVAVPDLPTDFPVLQTLSREQAQQDLELLMQALDSCPAVVSAEKETLVNRIRLRLAMEEFELKKTVLALELAKNNEDNRPTAQLTQATNEYNRTRERVEKLAQELFPPTTDETTDATLQEAEAAPAAK
ncbi:MAG: hypothetical protein MJ053_04115 [Elusimicrobiaceae bacterium]|nr:hypothetical protein [Elusimicrobiaceae bacterium]